MIGLALQQLRRRIGRYASLFFAIFASVALSVGATALTNSLVDSVNDLFAKPYNAADVVITATAKDAESFTALQDQLHAIPGVAAIAFDQSLPISLREHDGIYASAIVSSISTGPLQWRDVIAGRLPEGSGEIVVAATPDAPEVGSQVSLRIPAEEADTVVHVVGQVETAAQETLGGNTMLLATPEALQEWTSSSIRGEFRVAGGVASTSILEQAQQVAGTSISATSAPAHVEKLSDSYLGQRDRYFLLLTAFVLVAAAVAFLVVFSAYSVLTGERIREFGLIRAIGASTPQIFGSVLVESALLGIVASGLGAPAGVFAANLLADQAVHFGVRVPIDTINIPGMAMWAIALIGVLMSVLAAMPAVISACRRSTVVSLGTPSVSASNRWLSILWLLIAIISGVSAWWAQGQVALVSGEKSVFFAIFASGTAVLCLLILCAVLLPPLLYLLSTALGRTPWPTLQLGLAFSSKQKSRSAALIAVILAGSALCSAVLHGQAKVGDHLMSAAQGMGGTDVSITGLDGEISEGLVEALAQVSGVAAITAPATASVNLSDSGSTTALLLDEQHGSEVLRSGETGAPEGSIILGKSSGEQENFKPNEEAPASINDIEIPVRILHNSDYATYIDPGVVSQARELKAQELGISVDLLPEQPIRTVLIRLDGPANQDPENATVQEIREVISGFEGRYSVSEGFSARANTVNLVSRVTTMSTLLAVVALLIAAVGLLNTVALTVAERRGNRELLRSVGLSSTGQTIVMSVEMLALALPSAALGALAGGVLGNYVAAVATGSTFNLGLNLDSDLDLAILGGTPLAMALGAVLCGIIVLKRRS